MKKPNINLKRKINLDGKIIILFSLGLLLGLASGSGLITVLGQERKEPLVVKKDNEATKSGEILGTFEFPSPTPSPLPTSTPTPTSIVVPIPTPTNSTSSPEGANSSPPTDTASSTPNYSGPPLSSSPEKKELLIISDSLPGGWIVEKEEKVTFVPGEIGLGQALKVEEGGSLFLSGGEVSVNSGTISFWFKLETAGNGEAPLLVWNFDGLNQPFSFEISFAEPQLLFSIYDETGNQEGVEFDLENPYSWHYVVATWDLTKEPYQRTLFIDGKKVASSGFPFVPKICSQPLFQIGGIVGGRDPASFLIDELVLTNWAKSEEEVVMPE